MQVPVRLVAVLRPQVHRAVLAAVAVATVVFSASPFLVQEVAQHYGLGLSLAALISTAQLGGFGLASFGAGRLLAGRRHLFIASSVALVAANLLSALVPPFAALVALRFVAGAAMGVTSWMAWSAVFGHESRTSEVSMVGPLVGIVAAPLIAPVVELGVGAIYLVLAAWSFVPLVLTLPASVPASPSPPPGAPSPTSPSKPPRRSRHQPTSRAVAILISLALFSAGGSGVWMFTAVFGEDRGLSLTMLAWAYSANAIAGVVSARWSAPRGPAGVWVVVIGGLALALCVVPSAVVQLVIMAAWGFCFWMGLPAAFTLLAAVSRYPEERAGDAQAYLAAGRVLGPTIGGFTLDYGGAAALGLVAAVAIVTAGMMLLVAARTGNKQAQVGVI